MDGIIGQESSTLDPAKLTLHTRDGTVETGAKLSHSVLDSSPTRLKCQVCAESSGSFH